MSLTQQSATQSYISNFATSTKSPYSNMTTLGEHSLILTQKLISQLKDLYLGCSTPQLPPKPLSLALTLQEDADVWCTTANWHP